LFESRPIVSPLTLSGIVYYTSSLIMQALEYEPFKHVNLGFLNLSLADIETTVTSYAAYRTQSLQTPKQLIVEIDRIPEIATPLVPAARPSKMSGMNFQVSCAVNFDGTNSVHPAAATYSSNQHFQDHRAFPPYGAMMWHQDGSPYGPRPGISPSATMQQSRLSPAAPAHSYLTRHNSSDMGRTQSQYPMGLTKPMPPPPPYPGHSAGIDSNNWSNASTPPLDPSGFTSGGTAQSVTPVTSPVVRQSSQAISHARVLDAGHPEPVPIQVSPTKKLAVEKKPGNVETASRENRSSPFYLVRTMIFIGYNSQAFILTVTKGGSLMVPLVTPYPVQQIFLSKTLLNARKDVKTRKMCSTKGLL
jgi:hypothetical protein